MRAIRRIAVVVLALMLCFSTAAVADRGHGNNDRVSVVPANRVGWNSGGELLKDWFSQNLSMKAFESPFEGQANVCLDLGRRGQIPSPAGGEALANDPFTIEMTCTVKLGQSVLLVGPSADCSSNEPSEPNDFQAFTPWEQRKCALGWLATFPIQSLDVSVDDQRPVDIYSPRFLAVSPQGRTVFDAEDPVFDAKPGKATFVAAAWIAEIRGMGKGDHVVKLETTLNGENGATTVRTFIVHFRVSGR